MKLLKPNVRRFFRYMNERQRIYMKRELGDPWPWTKDKILQEWKFCNVFRQDDRVTKELTKRKKALVGSIRYPGDLLGHIAIFRMYNWPETYDIIHDAFSRGMFCRGKANKELDKAKARGEKIFTGAYMVTGSGSEGRSKHELANESLEQIWKKRHALADDIIKNNTLRNATLLMTQFPMISHFGGYEIACDLRHTKVLGHAKDIHMWANAGPGALRGLSRIITGGLGLALKPDEANKWMRELQAQSPLYLEKFFFDQLEMRDIEHTLCEFDKYERIRNDEGRPRSKYQPPIGVTNA